MTRTGLYAGTGVGTGLIVSLMALAEAPTWALIAAAFVFSFLIWNDLESRMGQKAGAR